MAGIGDVLAKTAGKGAGVSTVSSYFNISSEVCFIRFILFYARYICDCNINIKYFTGLPKQSS